MNKLIVFIMLATIPFLLGFFGIGMPEVIVILVILGSIGLPILIAILIINAKKERVPPQSVQTGKFCSNCGKEIAPNAYVCLGCGVKLVQESSTNKNKLVAALRHPPHEYVRKTSVQTLKEMTGRDFGNDPVEWEELRDENRPKFTEAEIGKIEDATAVQSAEEVGRPASEITDEDLLYVQTLQELEPDQMDKATWARAFAEEHGDEKILGFNPGASEEMRNHTRSEPPPDEPPLRSKKTNQTTGDKGPKESEPPLKPPPKHPFAHPPIQTIYAGYWNRFAALFIDTLIVGGVGFMFYLPFYIAMGMSRITSYPFWIIFDTVISLLIGWLYFTLFESSIKQGTIGKMAVGIIVTDLNGNRISFGRANVRWWGKSISFLILGIGYIMAGFTRKKQALHDIITDTLVLKKSEKVNEWVTALVIIIWSLCILSIVAAIAKPQYERYRAVRLAQEQERSGISLFRTGQYDKAIYDLNKAISNDSNNAKAYAYRGAAFCMKGKYEEAIGDLNKAISIDKYYMESYYYRGTSFFYKGQHDHAIEDLNKTILSYPGFPLGYFVRGRAFYMKGEYDKAIEDFNKSISLNPNHAEAYFQRGHIYCYELEQYGKALEDFNKVIELDPNNGGAYYGRGYIFAHKYPKYDKAVEEFSKAIELTSNNPGINHKIYFQRAYVYFELGKCDNAIKDITVAINLNPNNDDYYVFRARYYMEKSKYDEAIDDLNKAMVLKPGEALAYSLRGAIHLRKGNFIKAIEDFNKAIEINPNRANYYNDRGYTYLELGKYESAIKDFSRALEVDKKYADSYVGLSVVYFRQKKREESKTYYQKAIEIEPLFKNEMNVIEKKRRYFYTQSQKQTIKEILKLCSNR